MIVDSWCDDVPTLKWRVAGSTDIGGSNENQDDMFIWQKKSVGICIICVLDGHGREVGKLAAASAKKCLINYFEQNYMDLLSVPYECLVRAHSEAHSNIKEAFKTSLTAQGWEVVDYKDYLLKRRKGVVNNSKSGWQCVHGGTSCSIVALVGGFLYAANVGDSSGILCTHSPVFPIVKVKDAPSNAQPYVGEDSDILPGIIYIGDSAINSKDAKSQVQSVLAFDSWRGEEAVSKCSRTSDRDSGGSDSMSNSSASWLSTSTTSVTSMGAWLNSSVGSLASTVSLYPSSNCNNSGFRLNKKGLQGITASAYDAYCKRYMDINGLGSRRPSLSSVSSVELSDTMMITAEHSPESVSEFHRLRKYFPSIDSYTVPPAMAVPSLAMVYDDQYHGYKYKCPAIFGCEEGSNDQVFVTNRGRYYKNVRKEWATLVATPSSAKFQDALAFTRSLGDFHLHTYGVSQFPEIQMIDLSVLFRKLHPENSVDPDCGMKSKPAICIVLATDGVWDNWLYEDVTKFVLDESRVCSVLSTPENDDATTFIEVNDIRKDAETLRSGIDEVCHSFMTANMHFASRNFGNQADNASGILLYITE